MNSLRELQEDSILRLGATISAREVAVAERGREELSSEVLEMEEGEREASAEEEETLEFE